MDIDDQKQLTDDVITGKRKTLDMKDTFEFECIGCGKCCFNQNIVVNVYDLIRLRHAVKLPTHELLKKDYINFYLGPTSGLPVITLNYKKVDENSKFTVCPFLMPALNFNDVIAKFKELCNGDEIKIKEMIEKYKTDPESLKKDLSGIKIDKWLCAIHEDRPIICRLFPCGRLQQLDKTTKQVKEDYILQDDAEDRAFCPGFGVKKSTSLGCFLASQDFWHSKEGSAKFTTIMDLLITTGFFAETPDNKESDPKPLFLAGSKIIVFLGNILYNFDSFNTFSADPRVVKTIYDPKPTQEDYLYVMEKIFIVVQEFITMMKDKNPTEEQFQLFVQSLTKGGDKT